jgi:hypothetical protein
MPAISQLLVDEGCAQMGADFYYPPNVNPHLHIRINNAAIIVNTLADIRQHVNFILITNIPGRPNLDLTPPYPNPITESALRNTAFEVMETWGVANRDGAQRLINFLTGLGVDV